MSWSSTIVYALAAIVFLLAPTTAHCQFGAAAPGSSGLASPPSAANAVTIAEPDSQVAQAIEEAMDREVTLGKIKVPAGRLGKELRERLGGLPVFVDSRGLQIAEVAADKRIKTNVPTLPLRASLRHLLEPHALRAVVENEGLVITADFTALTRRGIACDQWVGLEPDFVIETETALDAIFSENFVAMPLEDAAHQIQAITGLQIAIDQRALEEIGLSIDQPVSVSVSGVPLRSFLNMLLRQLDLTYMTKDNVLTFTTIEAAEASLQTRIYWLEGTGRASGDYQPIINAIQSTIVPDTWEALGGPSTIVPLGPAQGSRPAIIVSSIYQVHHEIEMLLKTMRRGHVGPDPIATFPSGGNTAAQGGDAAAEGGGASRPAVGQFRGEGGMM
jgi:hypothetical protein